MIGVKVVVVSENGNRIMILSGGIGMKLTNKDKEILRKWGYSEDDLKQIEEATRKTVYELNSKEKISCKDAIKLIGRKAFLSRISRSAFHWSASRYTEDGNNFVSFDSSKLFQ